VIIVELKFDKKMRQLFKSLDIDIKKLQRYSSFILNEYKNTRKVWFYDLKVNMVECNTSGYYFGEDLIEIGRRSPKRSIHQKRVWFLSSFFHELCHFAQDNLDKVTGSKLDYSEEDAAKCTDKYYKNPMEIQARLWEEKYTNAYIELFHN